MKTFYTSCWGRSKSFPAGRQIVQISSTKSRFLGKLETTFTPDLVPWTFGQKLPADVWKPAYQRQLESLHAQGKVERIISSLQDGAILCCYEGDANDCHRTVLANFLTENGLAAVQELIVPNKNAAASAAKMVKKASEQILLF